MMKNLLLITLVSFFGLSLNAQTFTLKTINGVAPNAFLNGTNPVKTFPVNQPVDFVFDYADLPEKNPGNARVVIRFYEPGSSPSTFTNVTEVNGFVAGDPNTREGTITYTPTEEVTNWTLQVFVAGVGTSGGYLASSVSVATGATLSLAKQSQLDVNVYPNPTDGLLHISDVSDMQRVTILNLLGQNVKTLEAAKTLDVSDLKEGVYFLSADNGLTRKFIKE